MFQHIFVSNSKLRLPVPHPTKQSTSSPGCGHLVDNFATNASGGIRWDYFKLPSVRKLTQVEMLYHGSVVPLAMFFFSELVESF